MLRIEGCRGRYCDGINRRSFLQVGALGFAGLTLADLFRLEAHAGVASSRKALINVYLSGGPSHLDMFDLKPDAPIEYRGEFSATKTNVPGIEICEHFPRLAKAADRFAVLRSVIGTYDDHSFFHTQTGYFREDLKAVGGWPALGSVLSRLGAGNGEAPPFVSFMGDMPYGFLGPTHQAYRPDGPGRANLSVGSISADRLKNRANLLKGLDRLRRDADASGMMSALDSFTQRAVDVVVSGRLADALDVNKESLKVKQRYLGPNGQFYGENERFLLARRLVEAGVRSVTLSWGGWDTHSANFTQLRQQLPALDLGLSALLDDLQERGLKDDVLIVMWGEFGRTPRVNSGAGRDHWSRVMQAFLAGGGLKTGQVVGATDRYGGEAAERPVHLREVFATLYRHFGIDAKNTTIVDPNGRPQYLVDGRDPIRELI